MAQADLEGRLLRVNAGLCEITGYQPDELVGHSLFEFTHPDDRKGDAEAFSRFVQAATGTFEIEKRYLRKDGESVWGRVVINLVRDDTGRPTRTAVVIQNITAGKRAEAAQRQAVERYERQLRLFDGVASTTPDFVYVFNREGRFLYANRRLLEVWGMSLPDIIGKTCRELGYEQWHHDMHMREIAQVIGSKKPIRGEVPFRAPLTGIFGVYEYIFTPVLGPDGEVELIAGTTRDVTDRKQIEETLRDRERQQRLLALIGEFSAQPIDLAELTRTICARVAVEFEVSRCGFSLVDVRGGTVLVTDDFHGPFDSLAGAYAIDSFGDYLRAETVVGRVVAVEDTATDPRTAHLASNLELLHLRAHLTIPLHRAGEWVAALWITDHAPRRWTQGEIETLRLIAERLWSVTERRQAEETLYDREQQFSALAESVPQLIWRSDATGRIDYVNDRWCNYTGQDSASAFNQGWLAAVHPDDRAQAAESWTRAANSGELYETEYRLRRGIDRTYRWFLVRGAPLRDDAGKITRWFGTSTDIHEQRLTLAALQESQRQLRETRDELEHANTALEQKISERTARLRDSVAELEHFSYTITHDMRAPLRAMQAFGQILREEYNSRLDATGADYLRRIVEAASRMDSLITDALNYAKAVQTEMVLSPIDPGALLRGIVESYPQFHIPLASVEIEERIPAVLANPAGLTQCVSNLLGNAVKFVAPGKIPHVRISGEVLGSNVRLWFEDNGIGIPADQRERVFVMFQRLSKNYEGTGVGLALVRKVAEKMRGRVGIESAAGGGSRFWLELCRAPQAQERA